MGQPSVDYMKGYFGQAAELEKHVYVLKKAMQKANKEMTVIYQEQEKAKHSRESYESELAGLDGKYVEIEKRIATDEANVPKFKRRIPLMLIFAILVGIAAVISLGMLGDSSYFNSEIGEVFGTGLLVLCFYAPTPFVVLFIITKVRLGRAESRLKSKPRNLVDEKEIERIRLESEISNSGCRSVQLVQNKIELVKMQNMISEKYRLATDTLKRLYGMDLIAPKYHNFQAMATFYEYLSTGRCVAIIGPGGVVATYEEDLQRQVMINHLSNIEAIVADTNQKMGYLCTQAEQANRQLASINANLDSIKVSSAATAANTAQISSYCSSINESVRRVESAYF